MDTIGHPVSAVVHHAGIQDRDGVGDVLKSAKPLCVDSSACTLSSILANMPTERRSRVSGTASVKVDQRVSERFLPQANDETENEQACSEEQNTARFRYVHFENCRCSVRLNVVDSETCHRSHR